LGYKNRSDKIRRTSLLIENGMKGGSVRQGLSKGKPPEWRGLGLVQKRGKKSRPAPGRMVSTRKACRAEKDRLRKKKTIERGGTQAKDHVGGKRGRTRQTKPRFRHRGGLQNASGSIQEPGGPPVRKKKEGANWGVVVFRKKQGLVALHSRRHSQKRTTAHFWGVATRERKRKFTGIAPPGKDPGDPQKKKKN